MRYAIFAYFFALVSGCGDVASKEKKDAVSKVDSDFTTKQMPPKHFTFLSVVQTKIKCTSLCDDPKGKAIDSKEFGNHEKMLPFNQDQEVVGDSIQIAFNFIDKCNEHFDGVALLRGDTLTLQYEMVPFDTAKTNCYCMYRMSYEFGLNQRMWAGVKVARQ